MSAKSRRRKPGKVRPVISRAEARAWQARWELVAEQDLQALRAMTPCQKLAQLGELMSWVDVFGWREALEAEDEMVRERWNQLRRIYRGEG